jgi:hypothetical protein
MQTQMLFGSPLEIQDNPKLSALWERIMEANGDGVTVELDASFPNLRRAAAEAKKQLGEQQNQVGKYEIKGNKLTAYGSPNTSLQSFSYLIEEK